MTATMHTRRTIWQLLIIAAFMGIGWVSAGKLSFKFGVLNSVFHCAFYLLPFLAIRPVLRLHGGPRIWGLALLIPLLLLSSLLLLAVVGGEEITQPLQTFQQGSSTVQLQRYENGGALGIHGLNLEQRRLILPGLYMVRSVDFFDWAQEGTLSVEGPYRVRVHAKGSYNSPNYEVEKVYSLKPWIYF